MVKAQSATTQKKKFATETKQVLELFAKWLYQNKEIFLRELISNASDANDKLKMLALKDEDLFAGDSDLKIWVMYNKATKTLTVRDNGIGMSMDEVVENLGTIARSGTKQFIDQLSKAQSTDANGQLIGQFGVGFYSAFVVSDRVEVRTLRAGLPGDQGVFWQSSGVDSYEVSACELTQRGTEIVMHLKEDAEEFLDEFRLRKIITTYSDHIAYPIVMFVEKTVESVAGQDDKESKKDEKPRKEIQEEVVNQANAIWTVPKKDIKDDEYEAFYKHVSHDFNQPLAWTHNKVEGGKLEYTSLLYLPSQAPFDLWNREYKHGLKLYVQRVFILDDAKNLLPTYLRFVKGVVDSNDLPLNVSREVLQNSSTVDMIRSGCVKRVLDLLGYMAENESDKYQTFWDAFGAVLKEGPAEDFANKDKIAELLRFTSTRSEDSKQTLSLASYVEGMVEGQDKIYYVIADSYRAAKNSPHLELFKNKGIDVLLLSDRVDEWLVSRLTEYKGKSLVSIARGEVDEALSMDDEEKASIKASEEAFSDVLKQAETVLKERVKSVRLSKRLTSSASCIVADEDEMSVNLRRMLIESGQSVPEMKPILELNVKHPLMVRLKDEMQDERFADLANVLLDQAILAEGGQLEDPSAFVKRMNDLVS
ncbi:MAG: molecular chaperone HtpG [Legionellales bacterium]|nr:molecular chaperone HtpG [Legionellales bacterium]